MALKFPLADNELAWPPAAIEGDRTGNFRRGVSYPDSGRVDPSTDSPRSDAGAERARRRSGLKADAQTLRERPESGALTYEPRARSQQAQRPDADMGTPGRIAPPAKVLGSVTKSTVITHGGAVVSDAVNKLLNPGGQA